MKKGIICLLGMWSWWAEAVIISPLGREVNFSYETEFLSPHPEGWSEDEEGYFSWNLNLTEAPSKEQLETMARFHASHLFGILHSPELAKAYKIDSKKIEGTGSPISDMKFTKLSSAKIKDRPGVFLIKYRVQGRLLIHQNVEKSWVKKGKVKLPMISDLIQLYSLEEFKQKARKCTEEEYDTPADFFYFYDPFRKGCAFLRKAPLGKSVKVEITPVNYRTDINYQTKLSEIRGDNGNESHVDIYVVTGFAEDPPTKEDEGRILFKHLNDWLVSQHEFHRKDDESWVKRKMNFARLDKTIDLSSYPGNWSYDSLKFRVNHLLIDPGPESLEFAIFWKTAFSQGDIIIYGGHSGLGYNLDLKAINETLEDNGIEPIEMNPEKRQILFLDSCASASYYYRPYVNEGGRANIDLMSYALSSYFTTSEEVHHVFWEALLDPIQSPTWIDLLSSMEAVLHGESYLLNAGGL